MLMIKIFDYIVYTLSYDLPKPLTKQDGLCLKFAFFSCAAVKRQIFGRSQTDIQPIGIVTHITHSAAYKRNMFFVGYDPS